MLGHEVHARSYTSNTGCGVAVVTLCGQLDHLWAPFRLTVQHCGHGCVMHALGVSRWCVVQLADRDQQPTPWLDSPSPLGFDNSELHVQLVRPTMAAVSNVRLVLAGGRDNRPSMSIRRGPGGHVGSRHECCQVGASSVHSCSLCRAAVAVDCWCACSAVVASNL